MVQIKLKGVIRVESPSPRSFWCGLYEAVPENREDNIHQCRPYTHMKSAHADEDGTQKKKTVPNKEDIRTN